MMAAVVALLLTATGASAAGLFLSQLRARERELIVRSALGAGRWRLIRQLVAECLLLTAGAAGVGLILAAGSLEVIASGLEAVPGVAAADADLSRVDGRFMAVGAAICTVAGLLFGVVPALTASRPHAARILRVGPGGSSRAGMFGNGLVVAQMAVALVLLTVTGAALTRFVRLVNVDLGFSNTRALTFDVTLPKERYSGRAGAVEFFARFHERLQTVPGVAHVGATNVGPRWTGTPVVGIRVRLADSDVNANQAPTPPQLAATPDYFAAMGIRLITGRTFTMEDSWPGAAPVVIVSESVATSLGVTAVAAVGRRVQLESDRNMADVIGVVRDVRLGSVSGFRFGQLYEPLSERRGWFDGRLSLAIDSTGDTVHLMEAARAVLADIDSDLTLYNVVQVQDLRAVYLPTERMTLAATGVFSTIALALCAVGLYGVLSQSVAQRTREVGIRIALGADLTRVRRSVVATGFRFAVSGGIIGSAGAYLGFKAGAAVLPRLDAPSFAMMACNSLVLLAVAAVAAWVPARRAAAVDPIQALRVE
jgi:predicted permease